MTSISRTPDASAGHPDAALGLLIDELTARLQEGRAVDLEACVAAHPEHADTLRRLVPALQLMGELAQGPAPLEVPGGGVLGEFRLVREVGRGGMGIVYEAERAVDGRTVAVKVLSEAAARESRSLARFRVECLAATSLDHPHIVPVYAIGCEQGVHYYAMRFVEGHSLAELIRGADRPCAREAARLIEQAAEAIEHAHQLGVLHRDIKPANLLVESPGHLWVVDFGLARLQGQRDITRTGDLIGTLRYMSPEQALGHRVLDPRSDVYSLGTTLYELITARPAFDGRDRQDLIRRIARDEPVAPRRLDPTIPRDLETIVFRAMAKEPDDRYGSAQGLADDLRRFLEGRPVLARRPGPAGHAARWARRHRVTATAASAALALAIVALVAGVALLWREQSRTRANLGLAVRALDDSLQLLDDLFLACDRGDGALEPARVDQIQALQRRTLATYGSLAARNPGDPEARRAMARAHRRFGAAWDWAGEVDRADAAYRSADEQWTALLSGDRGNADGRDEHAEALGDWGRLLYNNRRVLRAERPLRRAVELDRNTAAGASRGTRQGRRRLRNTIYLCGTLVVARRTEELEQFLREALAMPGGESVESTADRATLAEVYKLLGDVMHAKGRHEEGGRAYDRAVTLIESLAVGPPGVARDRREIATLFARMCSQTYCGTAQAEQVIPFYQRAIVAWDRVVAGFPPGPLYSGLRASAFAYLANRLYAAGRPGEAETTERRALEIREAMLRADPASARLRLETALELEFLGTVLGELGRIGEAEASFRRASALAPGRLAPKNGLAWLLATCRDPAARDPARAVAMAEEVVAARPDIGNYWNTLGLARLRAGNWAGAQAALEESMRLSRGGRSCDWLALALTRWHLGDPVDARRWYERASAGTDEPPEPVVAQLRAEVASLLDPPSAGARPASR